MPRTVDNYTLKIEEPLKLRSIQLIYNMEELRKLISEILSLCHTLTECRVNADERENWLRNQTALFGIGDYHLLDTIKNHRN